VATLPAQSKTVKAQGLTAMIWNKSFSLRKIVSGQSLETERAVWYQPAHFTTCRYCAGSLFPALGGRAAKP